MRNGILILFLFASALLKGQSTKFGIGDTFPNFGYQGQFTKKYELKDLRGSYVLVNYWASWNEESRKLQLDLVDTYARYRDRKFKKGRKIYVVSISLDEEIHIWEIALKKDNLPWKAHVCDGKGWRSPYVMDAGVNQIPANFLLDPNGRIIAKNIKKDQLEEILKGL